MEQEPQSIADSRDVYRFRNNNDLVVALGTTGLDTLTNIREILEVQALNVQADIAHVDAALERRLQPEA